MSCEGATPKEQQDSVTCYTAIRQLGEHIYPIGFGEAVRQKNLKIEIQKTENALLNYLIGMYNYLILE